MRIVIIATLDTKLEEALYIKNYLESNNCGVTIIDVGVFEDFSNVDISIKKILKNEGYNLKERILIEKRSEIMEKLGVCCGNVLKDLLKKGEINGVIGIGGNQGTAICGIAMQSLPFIIPKIIVTTIASGNMRSYIKNKDIFVVSSITDLFGGPNFININVINNAMDAIIAMVKNSKNIHKPDKKVIAITAFGNTSKGAKICSDLLIKLDFVPIIFHASGSGGSAMEELICNGYIDGVIDLTTHEIIGEIFDFDIYGPTNNKRLVSASEKRIPQIISTGGLDYFVFGSPKTIPPFLRKRKTHYHNPYNTNVRTSASELKKVAELMAERINNSKGPVALLVPLKGWTEIGSIGNTLYDFKANNSFIITIERKMQISENKILEKLNKKINDYDFCETCVLKLIHFFN